MQERKGGILSRRKAHRILSKNEILQMDYMNLVLEAAASSGKFGTLTEMQDNGPFVTRANIHALLIAPFGSKKTTGLQVPGAQFANDVTFPGLLGTISKDGIFVPGLVARVSGGLMIIDEFQRMDDSVKNAMNSLLEYPHTYSRNLGYSARVPFKKHTKYCSIDVKEGWINVYGKFSCISGGMWLSRKNPVQQAWASRHIPIIFKPTLDYYKKMTLGEKPIKINPHMHEMDFIFRREEYKAFHAKVWENWENDEIIWNYFQAHDDERGYTGRMLQDLARLSCFMASLDKRSIIARKDWEKALKLQRIMALNTIFSDLTEIEMAILENPALGDEAISAKFRFSRMGVWKARKRLISDGLLKSDEATHSGFKNDNVNL